MPETNLYDFSAPTVRAHYEANEADRQALKDILGENLKETEPIARHTSWRIGGPADYFLRATDEAELVVLLKTCRSRGIPFLVIGNGSNMLVADKGWRGMVVENRLDKFTVTELDDGQRALLMAGSGALLGALSRRIAKLGWAGFEFAATIPGSVGGGIVSNAGAHGGDFSKILRRVAVATAGGEIKIFHPADLELSYRDSRWRERVGNAKVALGYPGNELILWAEFELQRGDAAAIKQHIDEMTDWRRQHQPQEPSGGSVFKNPESFGSAGSLIEKAGLKGHILGGAQISPRHANFIINRGEAKAQDVIDLINLARKTVKEQFGAEIEPEVEMLGEFD